MAIKNIILVGFPKSGTNWLSRLVAQLVDCSFIGDWGYLSGNVSSMVSTNQNSSFQVYKSHHIYKDMYNASSNKIFKIIYLIRDPRDVVISGAYFFSFTNLFITSTKKMRFHYTSRFLRKIYTAILTKKKKKKIMIKAVLFGNENISCWLKTPWESHYNGYINKNILFIKYEDLIETPESESHKILNYLGVEKSQEHILNCIENQSFEKRKNEVHNQNNPTLKMLVRKGGYGYWRKEFTEKEISLFRNTLKSNPNFYEF